MTHLAPASKQPLEQPVEEHHLAGQVDDVLVGPLTVLAVIECEERVQREEAQVGQVGRELGALELRGNWERAGSNAEEGQSVLRPRREGTEGTGKRKTHRRSSAPSGACP